MPLYQQGNVFEYPPEFLKIVTTNGYIRKNGELVMGRGAALDAKNRYPDLPILAGNTIRVYPFKSEQEFLYHKYGFVYLSMYDIGLFQVKYHWEDAADLDLIAYSVTQLNAFVSKFDRLCVMNYPGIGNGKRSKEEIMPLLEPLSPRVTIVEL
jgi:hypothetical protein